MTLPVEFFSHSPLQVARQLLGCVLVRRMDDELLSGRIVETEAYGGLHDPSCHVVARDRRIWDLLKGPPAVLYMHRSYEHYLLNIVTSSSGTPACVLVRALEPLTGHALMRRNRRITSDRDLTNGPAKLVQALAIKPDWEGLPLPLPEFWLEAGEPMSNDRVINTVRIGLKYGKDLPWRFVVQDNPWVSRKTVQTLPLLTDRS